VTARRAPRPAPSKGSPLIRAVMAACRRLGIDDETRHAIQLEKIGKASLTDMSAAELTELRDHFNRGWTGPKNQRPVIGKIRALWWSLYWIGAIERVDDDALNAFIKRQAHVQHINFLDHKLAPSVIEALKSWLEREGVMWWSAEQLEVVVSTVAVPFTQAQADRHAVLCALGDRLDRAGLIHKFGMYGWIGALVGRPTQNQWSFTNHELDRGLRALGKKYRRWLAQQGQTL
jgi:hypothetical protein